MKVINPPSDTLRPLASAEGDAYNFVMGICDGFPWCCIAQFVNDHYNTETAGESGSLRGSMYSRTGQGVYVSCWDCIDRHDEVQRARETDEEEFVGYHGTKPERIEGILKDGFSLMAEKVSDPGDLGRGVYLFSRKADTKVWGQARLRVTVRGRFLKVNYPTDHAVFEDLAPKYGDTVRGKGGPTYEHVWQERLDAAWAYRKHFMDLGYDGLLVWGYDTFPGRKDRYELVVFNLDCIKDIRLDGKTPSVWR